MTDDPRRASAETPKGMDILHDPILNKGTAFTEEERDALEIRGLLPPRVSNIEKQVGRVLGNYRRKPSDLERYIFLIALEDRNETLFYRLLVDHIEELMPIVYTPTVGAACKMFGHIYRRPRGLYISARDRGRVLEVMANWPYDAEIIVVTDGERILGLGDLGANGMGIPIGKLSLYSACAGIHPAGSLPIMLDVGTENEELLNDPLYLGIRQRRLRGTEYDEFVEEFVQAVDARFPSVLLQFEDFATRNAFGLLERYRNRICAFNDDIQGTAAVVLAGLLSAGRITGRSLAEEKLLFLGAGAAATGIGELVVSALARRGVPDAEARGRCWFVDSKGLVVQEREDLAPHKRPFAHEHPFLRDLGSAVEALHPTALIGVSGQAGAFTEPIVRSMAKLNERPVIFALSNPTANSECTAEQAYGWTEGRAVFASGSPFDRVELNGQTHVPGQANNAYVFPGIGLGVICARASRVTDAMFYVAAEALASCLDEDTLRSGSIFPPLSRIRDVSACIAGEVARLAYEEDLAGRPIPAGVNLEEFVRSRMYQPCYATYA